MDKLFKFVDPVLDFFDSGKICGKPIKWLYYLIGALCALFPIYLFVQMIDAWDHMKGGDICLTLLMWLFLAVLFFWNALFWYKRAGQVGDDPGAEVKYVALPVVAYFVKNAGESFGIIFAGMGILMGLLTLFMGRGMMDVFGGLGASMIIIAPIMGYLLVLFSRFCAERIEAYYDIANNTEKIAKK